MRRSGIASSAAEAGKLTFTDEGGRAVDFFTRFYLDKEKDLIVDLFLDGDTLRYVLRRVLR